MNANILNRRVLLLNQSYEPLMVVNAKRAIILLLCEKVQSIEHYKEKIHSCNFSIFLPSVIVLKRYVYVKKKEIVFSSNY